MPKKFSSESVHFTEPMDPRNRSKVQPIYQTSAFVFDDLADLEGYFRGDKDYLYTRNGNPNSDELGAGVARLEKAPAGVASSSGLSAIMASLLSVLKSGDHVVACEDLYGGTYQLMAGELRNFGIEATFVSFADRKSVEAAVQPNTKVLYSESISNPFLRVENLKLMVEIARAHDLVTIIDNTFATPYLVRPYEWGIDLVVHSATKYIGGHSDVSAGVLVGDKKWVNVARQKIVNFGLNLSPHEAWLACRGMKTLAVRMEKHNENAKALARYLVAEGNVRAVYYPEFVSEYGNGAIVSVDLGEAYDIERFFQHLSWVKIVPTLAGVETTVSYPLSTSHRSVPKETREKLGITRELVRISVGIEDAQEIIEAFRGALRRSRKLEEKRGVKRQ